MLDYINENIKVGTPIDKDDSYIAKINECRDNIGKAKAIKNTKERNKKNA
jgi:hypothetical protein